MDPMFNLNKEGHPDIPNQLAHDTLTRTTIVFSFSVVIRYLSHTTGSFTFPCEIEYVFMYDAVGKLSMGFSGVIYLTRQQVKSSSVSHTHEYIHARPPITDLKERY